MPRTPRANVSGVPHHVVHRGNNRQAVFFEDADYGRYRTSLILAAREYGCVVHGYVLMTNHVHLLATQRVQDGIARMMQVIAGRHTVHVNRTRGRSGTLWEGRHHASLVDTDRYFLECQRYIELNPVRAGIVSSPADYPWSSYLHNALGRRDECITEHDLYIGLASNPPARRQAYRALVAEVMSEASLSEIRLALRQNRPIGLAASQSRSGPEDSGSDPSLTLL